MASTNSKNDVVDVLKLPEINTLTPGNFLAVFSPNGTSIIDIVNLNFISQTPSGGVNLIDTLSSTDIINTGNIDSDSISVNTLTINGVDISDINTTVANISANILTTVAQVSTTLLLTTPNVYVAYATIQFPNTIRYAGISQFYTDPTQVTGSPVPGSISNFWNSDFNIAYLSNNYTLSSKIVLLGTSIVNNQSLSALIDLGQNNSSGVTLSAEIRVIKYY